METTRAFILIEVRGKDATLEKDAAPVPLAALVTGPMSSPTRRHAIPNPKQYTLNPEALNHGFRLFGAWELNPQPEVPKYLANSRGATG